MNMVSAVRAQKHYKCHATLAVAPPQAVTFRANFEDANLSDVLMDRATMVREPARGRLGAWEARTAGQLWQDSYGRTAMAVFCWSGAAEQRTVSAHTIQLSRSNRAEVEAERPRARSGLRLARPAAWTSPA